MKSRAVYTAAGVGAALVALAACGTGSEGLSETITVGYVNERPYAWVDGGDVRGTDIDIIRTCLDRTEGDKEYEFVQTEFEGLIPGLQGERFDVVAGGMLYNDERQEQADASSPTYLFRLAAMIEAGNPHNLSNDIESLISADGQIGAKQGTYDYEVLVEHPDIGDRVVGYDSSQSAYIDLENGRIIAVIDNEALVVDYLRSNPNPNLDIIQPFEGVYEPAGAVIWFRKGIEATVDGFNECISEIKSDGTLREILIANEYPEDAITEPEATTPNR